jgi:protein gp37
VSVGNRKHGLPRIDVLRTIPAAVRFLSIEPLLEYLGQDITGLNVPLAAQRGAASRYEGARRLRR